ncbi:iron-sulfur cluster biosynthesis family protein [Brevibacillus daliensis]|uniref:iron-sulfur cluster biosynthesis family protein n=1 Tax=Brevibacillus daliensis TaxID=2892995 RepID=UPI001E634976|nr:iron-sulfur cluster biosynthesis family protein [Brevibacillus daliensis]
MSLQLTITPEFSLAYQKYAGFKPGETIRLYVRTAGPGTGGLFYAVDKDDRHKDDAFFDVEGIRFVIRPTDFWYFDGGTLSYDEVLGEYGFMFHNPGIPE